MPIYLNLSLFPILAFPLTILIFDSFEYVCQRLFKMEQIISSKILKENILSTKFFIFDT